MVASTRENRDDRRALGLELLTHMACYPSLRRCLPRRPYLLTALSSNAKHRTGNSNTEQSTAAAGSFRSRVDSSVGDEASPSGEDYARGMSPKGNAPVAPPVTDSPRAWLTVAAAFIGGFVVFGIIYSFGVFIEPIGAELHTGRVATSALFSITSLTFYAFGSLTGYLGDRLGPRIVVSGEQGWLVPVSWPARSSNRSGSAT